MTINTDMFVGYLLTRHIVVVMLFGVINVIVIVLKQSLVDTNNQHYITTGNCYGHAGAKVNSDQIVVACRSETFKQQ